jgi:alkanesulfonate monooxygenase SsuD/methylene tetrahydromethanopterin reductase-like flavin-dependent oxidoreductase (luciferase family)
MITKFDSFYGGHVEMDNLGFRGTPVDDRRPSDGQLASVFDEAEKFAQLMEREGFDTLWLAEHHFQREGYGSIPNVQMLCLYLAQVTERLNFGGFFNSVPAWHPLRLAEDFAMADILTGGRVRFGMGRGYIAREVETLGAPLRDNEANRELFEEQVEIILKAWNEPSFSHHGKNYTIPARVPHRGNELEEITLVPRPLNRPVEIWQPITSATRRGYDFMAQHGIKGVIAGGTAVGGRVDIFAAEYREALARVGRETELGEGLAIGFQIHMADTQEKAMQEAAPFYEEQLKMLAPLGRFPKLTEEQIRATFDPAKAPLAGLPTIEDAVREGSWVCGPPEHIIEKLEELQKRFPGLVRVFITAGGLGIPPSVMRADIDWFGREVMPAFRKAVPVAE